jgi:hypothetical protein
MPFCAILFNLKLHAQNEQVKIHGSVICLESLTQTYNLMVVNKTTGHGIMANHNGSFTISVAKNDKIILSCTGYKNIEFSLKDSLFKPEYTLRFLLEKLVVNLSEVQIFSQRQIDAIKKDIERITFSYPYATYGVSSIMSPITALYERFSKFEKSKRAVAYLIAEDQKRELLKELFRLYVSNKIFDLKEDEFDSFLNFCNLPQVFVRNATEYELTMAVKACYEEFNNDYVRKEQPKLFYNPYRR